MAVAATPNAQQTVTLATTVTRLTGTGQVRTLVLLSCDVDFYVVTGDVADGASLPGAGRYPFTASKLPITLDVAPYGYIGVAGASAGSLVMEART